MAAHFLHRMLHARHFPFFLLLVVSSISPGSGFVASTSRRSIQTKKMNGTDGRDITPRKNGDKNDGWSPAPRKQRRRKGGTSRSGANSGSGQSQGNQTTSHAWSGPPLFVEPLPSDATTSQFQPFLLLLAGLPGSGKSTFAKTLVEAMPYKVSSSLKEGLGY